MKERSRKRTDGSRMMMRIPFQNSGGEKEKPYPDTRQKKERSLEIFNGPLTD